MECFVAEDYIRGFNLNPSCTILYLGKQVAVDVSEFTVLYLRLCVLCRDDHLELCSFGLIQRRMMGFESRQAIVRTTNQSTNQSFRYLYIHMLFEL